MKKLLKIPKIFSVIRKYFEFYIILWYKHSYKQVHNPYDWEGKIQGTTEGQASPYREDVFKCESPGFRWEQALKWEKETQE